MSVNIVAQVVDEHEHKEERISRPGICVGVGTPEAHVTRAQDNRAVNGCSFRSTRDDGVFKQFKKFFRRLHVGDTPTVELLDCKYANQPYILKAGTFLGTDPNQRLQATRSLWKNDRDAITSGSNVWEHEEIPSMNCEWERVLRNTSIVGGIEDWVKQLEVPEVPDNRVKLIFASICAERKKLELCNQIEESLLQTDSGLCSLVIQMQINRAIERFRLIKYSVETIEDLLILLSQTSVEATQRNSLVEKLAATIHGEAMIELIQFSYARNLLLVSLGILLDSNFKTHAFEVLKTLISSAVRDDVASRSMERESLLAGIIARCNPTESMWLREQLLAVCSRDKNNPVSEFSAVIHKLLPRLNPGGSEEV